MKAESIIFDIDGTLWNTLPLVEESWNAQLQSEGMDRYCVTQEDLMRLFGHTTQEIAQMMVPDMPLEQSLPLTLRCMDLEHEYLEKNTRDCTYPDTVPALRRLAKSHRLFLVSNSEAGYPELLIRKLGIADSITDHLCYGDTLRSKGENIRAVMERNGVQSAVYVGDTQGDCNASALAGIPFVWAAYGFGKPDRWDEKIQTINDLEAFLQEDK